MWIPQWWHDSEGGDNRSTIYSIWTAACEAQEEQQQRSEKGRLVACYQEKGWGGYDGEDCKRGAPMSSRDTRGRWRAPAGMANHATYENMGPAAGLGQEMPL